MADSSPEGIGCRDLCRHLTAPLVQDKFTKVTFISADSDSDLPSDYSPRLEVAVVFFLSLGFRYNLYAPTFDPTDSGNFDPYAVLQFCIECLYHIGPLIGPLQRDDMRLVRARPVETDDSSVMYHETLARATELKECVYRRLEQALKKIRGTLATLVGQCLHAERLNQAGDGAWESHLNFNHVGFEGALLVLDVENNEDERWNISQDDFRGLFDSPPSAIAQLVPCQAGVHGDENAQLSRRCWPLFLVQLSITQDVLAEWDEAQTMLHLSGTFSITHKVGEYFEKSPLDKRTKKLLRHADFVNY